MNVVAATFVRMPSHLSSIGFDISEQPELEDLARRTVREGEWLPAPGGGGWCCWAPGEGIELWATVDRDDVLVALDPHAAGEARVPVAVTERVPGTEDEVCGWLDPQDECDPESGIYPLCFSVPGMGPERMSLPALAHLQLAAFATRVEGFPSAAAFEASQEPPGFAAESFVPSGLFVDDGDPVEPEAFFHGTVLEAGTRVNPVTHAPFSWARVRTLGTVVEVVADREVVEAAPRTGGVVAVEARLSGRLHDVRPLPRRGRLSSALGRRTRGRRSA